MFHLAAAKSSTVLSYIYFGADIDRGAALVPQMYIVFIEESDSRIWFLWFMRPVFPGKFVRATTKFQPICRQVRQLFHMLVSPLLFVCLSWSTCLPLYSSLLRLLPHSLSLPCKKSITSNRFRTWLRISVIYFFPGKKREGYWSLKKYFHYFAPCCRWPPAQAQMKRACLNYRRSLTMRGHWHHFIQDKKKIYDSKHGCERVAFLRLSFYFHTVQ